MQRIRIPGSTELAARPQRAVEIRLTAHSTVISWKQPQRPDRPRSASNLMRGRGCACLAVLVNRVRALQSHLCTSVCVHRLPIVGLEAASTSQRAAVTLAATMRSVPQPEELGGGFAALLPAVEIASNGARELNKDYLHRRAQHGPPRSKVHVAAADERSDLETASIFGQRHGAILVVEDGIGEASCHNATLRGYTASRTETEDDFVSSAGDLSPKRRAKSKVDTGLVVSIGSQVDEGGACSASGNQDILCSSPRLLRHHLATHGDGGDDAGDRSPTRAARLKWKQIGAPATPHAPTSRERDDTGLAIRADDQEACSSTPCAIEGPRRW